MFIDKIEISMFGWNHYLEKMLEQRLTSMCNAYTADDYIRGSVSHRIWWWRKIEEKKKRREKKRRRRRTMNLLYRRVRSHTRIHIQLFFSLSLFFFFALLSICSMRWENRVYHAAELGEKQKKIFAFLLLTCTQMSSFSFFSRVKKSEYQRMKSMHFTYSIDADWSTDNKTRARAFAVIGLASKNQA